MEEVMSELIEPFTEKQQAKVQELIDDAYNRANRKLKHDALGELRANIHILLDPLDLDQLLLVRDCIKSLKENPNPQEELGDEGG